MIRFFALFLLFPLFLVSQTETALLSYHVVAAMNERTREVSGTVHISTVIKDRAVNDFTFLVPKEWTAVSVLDVNNEVIDLDRSPSDRPGRNRITFDRSDLESAGDTAAFFVTFTAVFDSVPAGSMFTAPREFILPYNRNNCWLPEFASPPPVHASLRFAAAQQFIVISSVPSDTSAAPGMRTWTFIGPNTPSANIYSIFSICGITNAVKQTSVSPDSMHSITFYSSSLRFNQQYAAATAEQLSAALQFFRTITRHEVQSVTYVIIGSTAAGHEEIDTGAFVLRSNSPAFAVFDSSALKRSLFNPWIIELARRFCPPVTDSTALFDDGLSAYLASRFLITQFPGSAWQERFDALSHALTFFPSGTLAAGHSDKANTNRIISYRGRYLFFMLEYLLGRESLDRVITGITSPEQQDAITFERFIALCETEYGLTLRWFFDQWLLRSSAPEFVLQWRSEKTVRGLAVVKAVVEQRGTLFSMPVPLTFSFGTRVITKRVMMEQQKQEFTFTFPSPPTAVEFDPQLNILRWLLELRISAHAKTALLFLSVNRDLSNAEREALYTQQLDPTNATGNAPLALYIMGNISAASGNRDRAKEFFLQSSSASSSEETEPYRLLSLIRTGNLLELEGKREEAATYYQRAVTEGLKDPLVNAQPLTEAERYLRERFVNTEQHWYPKD